MTDNRGYGCINRLQMGCGGAEFNNLLDHAIGGENSNIDFRQTRRGDGGNGRSRSQASRNLRKPWRNARPSSGPYVLVIDTDPYPSTEPGGTWWGTWACRKSRTGQQVTAAYAGYLENKKEAESGLDDLSGSAFPSLPGRMMTCRS